MSEAKLIITDEKKRFALDIAVTATEATLVMEYALRLINHRKLQQQQTIEQRLQIGLDELKGKEDTFQKKPTNNSKEKK